MGVTASHGHPVVRSPRRAPSATTTTNWDREVINTHAVVLEEDLSDEEANSAGPVKWVVPAWEVLAADRGGWRAGLKGLRVNEREVGAC
jgi:hypothetical protein